MGVVFFIIGLGYLIDLPTPYIPIWGSYEVETRIQGEGEVIFRLGVSVFMGFNFGISYGGKQIVGKGEIDFNSHPNVQIKIGTSISKITWSVGYEGEFYSEEPTGGYVVIGGLPSWKVIPYLGVSFYHSFKPFWGCELGIIEKFSLACEGVIKNKEHNINTGLRFRFSENVAIEYYVKKIKSPHPSRGIKFWYIDYIQ